MITQKDTRQKILSESFEWIKGAEDVTCQKGICKEKGTGFYANHVDEVAEKNRE